MNPGRGGDGKTRFIFIRKPDENPQAFPFVFPPILPCFYARGGGAVAELPPPFKSVCVCVSRCDFGEIWCFFWPFNGFSVVCSVEDDTSRLHPHLHGPGGRQMSPPCMDGVAPPRGHI